MNFDLDFYKGKKVFVTGHTGFKGSWLCKMLANAGAIVTGYSLNPPTKKVICCKLKDTEKLMASQSGGAFTAIATAFLKCGGIVYGCEMDNSNQAVYKRIDHIEKLEEIKGSKYVQAKLGNTYAGIEADLKLGRIVLFSGTPCYVMAVKQYFSRSKFYYNLYTVDLICHGVPSPRVYNSYLHYLERKMKSKIKEFIFRDKIGGGWHKHV